MSLFAIVSNWTWLSDVPWPLLLLPAVSVVCSRIGRATE